MIPALATLLVCQLVGEALVRTLAVPVPGPGQVLIRHAAVGVNFIDVYFRQGVYPWPVERDLVLGSEGSGTVEALGEGVTGFQIGQRVAYTMLDLNQRGRDVRKFVCALENWVIATLAEFNVKGEIRPGRVGVWVTRPDKAPNLDGTPREEKIAAIGVKLRKWVSFHGISINVEPDLSHFSGIVPCGIREHGVTSLVDLGLPVTMADLDAALMATFDGAMQSTCPV